MTDSSPVRVAPIGAVDALTAALAPDAYYQTPGGRTFLIAASMLGGLARGATVLDVSCGIGQAAVDLAESFACKVTAFDNFPPYLAFGRQLAVSRGVSKLISFMELEGENLREAFPAASFDVVLGMGGGLGDVFAEGIDAGLSAASHWLKPGGLLICGDLISPATVSPLMEIVFDQTLIAESDYLAAVAGNGFETIFAARATSADWNVMRATIESLRGRNLIVGTDDEQRRLHLTEAARDHPEIGYLNLLARKIR
ncbi:MAG TPA: class I SAM-dependent methyltransferase [Thermomicrobiales bacterium]|nr:class I SAM-dependent methyltransferase [Thermomicrobiales bacterium]